MKLKLTIQNGLLAGRTAELESGFLTIGRDVNCTIKFDPNERVVSTKHAYVEARNDGFYLVDNHSTNGTYVNGIRLEQPYKLTSGETVYFGRDGIAAKVFIENPQAAFQQQFQPPQNFPALPVNQNQSIVTSNWLDSMTRIGLKNPVIEQPKSSQTGKKIGVALTIFAVVFLALIVTVMIAGSLGVGPALIASVVAFVPACIYILPLVLLDRYDPEPPWLLALAFAWGALVAVIFSATVNDLMGEAFGRQVQLVVSAPVFEEGSKGLGLILLLLFFRREFDDILDGIVYGGTIALGFATVENVLYYGGALIENGLGGLVVLFFMRGILSPFAHVTFTSMTGIGCGVARESHDPLIRFTMPVLGYGVAVLLHAIWNGTPAFFGVEGFWYGYVFVQVPFFAIFVSFAGYVMYRQNKILREMLAIDVARGLITQEQLDIATSVFKSTSWLLSGLGGNKFGARQRFLRATGKLGLTYWHIQRATSAKGHTGSFQQNPILREEVLKWRDQV